MGKPTPYNSKKLTEHLRQLAAEAHDWSEESGVLTKGEALAQLLWRKALGWTEKIVDDEGNEKEVHHKPEQWAVQLVYDRIEGKTPQAVPEEETRISAADRVSELAKKRLNSVASKYASAGESLKHKGPPTRKKEEE